MAVREGQWQRILSANDALDFTLPVEDDFHWSANVAKMVINDINSKGGLLGRRLDLYLEDSATTDSVGEAKGRAARRRWCPDSITSG